MGSLSKGAWHRTVGLMWKNHLMCVSSMFCRHRRRPRGRPLYCHICMHNKPPVSTQLRKKTKKKNIRAHACGGALRGPPLADPWQHHPCSSKTALRWLSSPHKQISAAPRWVREALARSRPPSHLRGSADLLSCVWGTPESAQWSAVTVVLTALHWDLILGAYIGPVTLIGVFSFVSSLCIYLAFVDRHPRGRLKDAPLRLHK